MKKNKCFASIAVVFIIVILVVGGVVYYKINNSKTISIINPTINWKRYQNDIYGFELKHPSSWVLRDGNKDYKQAGLNNFYQFCSKVITTPNEPLGPNDNFVGSCESQFIKVDVWNPDTEIKIVTNYFSTLKLITENKITIGGQPASELVYSGLSQISGETHTWHLFIVHSNNFIYSISGDSCMDNQIECHQVISNFGFIGIY